MWTTVWTMPCKAKLQKNYKTGKMRLLRWNKMRGIYEL